LAAASAPDFCRRGARLHDHRLAHGLGQFLAEHARDGVGVAAGREALQEMDLPRRIILGESAARGQRQDGGKCQAEAWSRHGSLPCRFLVDAREASF
jgi:hypothetical protein